MDGPQPVNRQAPQRVMPVRRHPETPRPVAMAPRSVQPQVVPRSEPQRRKPVRSAKRFIMPITIVLLLILLAAASWFAWSLWSNKPDVASEVDTSKHQAVFFENGQFYFGKLEIINDDYMKMREVFYVQTGPSDTSEEKTDESKETTDAEMRLIKLGDEVHGPEDTLLINRDQVLFFENLKPDGKVSQLIQQYKSGNN